MRRFFLTNAKGQAYDLNRKDAFFANPEGLGHKTKNIYAQIGTSFLTTKQLIEQKRPSGKLYFAGYREYADFSAFVQFTPLTLTYQPYEGEELYMDVAAVDLSKGEIVHPGRRLVCPVQFIGVSAWYKARRAIRNVPEGTGKSYPYAYPYTYLDNTSGYIDVLNRYSLDAYIKLIIMGPADTPYWEIRQGGKLLLTGRILGRLEAGRRLVVDADPRRYEIAEYDDKDHKIRDRYGDSDFSTDRFLYAPPGESRVSFTHNDVTELTAYVEVCEIVE